MADDDRLKVLADKVCLLKVAQKLKTKDIYDNLSTEDRTISLILYRVYVRTSPFKVKSIEEYYRKKKETIANLRELDVGDFKPLKYVMKKSFTCLATASKEWHLGYFSFRAIYDQYLELTDESKADITDVITGPLGGDHQTLNSLFAPLHTRGNSSVVPAELSEKAAELLSTTCEEDSPGERSVSEDDTDKAKPSALTSQDGAKQLDSIVLVKEEKPGSSKKIYKCALCGKQETNMDELEGKDDKRVIITSAVKKLNDEKILENIAEFPTSFMYHNQFFSNKRKRPRQCYKILMNRLKRSPSPSLVEDPVPAVEPSPERLRKSTRSRSSSGEMPGSPTQPDVKKSKKETTVCDICQQRASGRWPNLRYRLCRISEMKQDETCASKFLSAMVYNEDHVYRKFIFCKSIGDLFAADVMYHPDCMKVYLIKYNRQVQKVFGNLQREESEITVENIESKLLKNLDFNTKAYKLSEVTKLINGESPHSDYDNRRTKSHLIKIYGEDIVFSYSRDRSLPQIVFKKSVKVEDIIEGNLRKHDVIKECADLLASEIQTYNFNLDDSMCLPRDLKIATETFCMTRPPDWLKFVTELFATTRHKKGEEWFLKFDAVFQIFYRWLTGRISPLHVAITEMIHNISKSREIIDVLNRLNFGVSYDTMMRIDTEIVEKEIAKTGDNRGPVNDSINPGTPIQAAVDNFNHKERSNSGKEVTNDTVLVIWQNNENIGDTSLVETISKRSDVESCNRKRSLHHRLPCQQLIESKLTKNTGEVSEGFSPTTNFSHKSSLLKTEEDDNFTWFAARNLQHINDDGFVSNIPSLTAVKSRLQSAVKKQPCKTSMSFYPMLPYPATQMDSIYTAMINFKDVLSQKGECYGALWCDEGVYCLAKEIQLLKPELFDMLYIGMGPFHWSKIVMGAVGKWLKSSGITEALINSEVFTPGAATTNVIQAGDYIMAKDGMNIISEAITLLQFKAFLQSEDYSLQKHILGLDELQYDMDEVFKRLYDTSDADHFQGAWELATISLEKLQSAFREFRDSNKGDENFEYWNLFLDFMYPCVRDFEASVRGGSWELFLSAVERSLVIFFATGKHNYCRYGPLFYQDSLDIQRKFPDLYRHYQKGMFVCHMSERYGSGVGFDQGLEKAYNRTAKAKGGIIGVTRQKVAIAKWDIMKHHKDQYVSHMKDMVRLKEEMGELDSLHHEFSANQAQANHSRVRDLVRYIESVKNPFTAVGAGKLTHLTTLEEVPDVSYLLDSVERGRSKYNTFTEERLVLKVKGLHETISFKTTPTDDKIVEIPKVQKMTTDDQENDSAVSFLQYAMARGCKVEDLLSHPITSRPVYLLEKDSDNQRTASKSDLSRFLLKYFDKDSIIISDEDEYVPHISNSTDIVVDFMSVVRRFSAVKRDDIKSFGSFCSVILNAITSYGSRSQSIHVIMENYCDTVVPL